MRRCSRPRPPFGKAWRAPSTAAKRARLVYSEVAPSASGRARPAPGPAAGPAQPARRRARSRLSPPPRHGQQHEKGQRQVEEVEVERTGLEPAHPDRGAADAPERPVVEEPLDPGVDLALVRDRLHEVL